MKDYYLLLAIIPAASQDEIKRAFRALIARYHPDKVQHLGLEFQAMAAERSAELTAAYRILSDPGRRTAYDAARTAAAGAPPDPAPAAASSDLAPEPEVQTTPRGEPSQPATAGRQFVEERASRDQFVRRATVGRFRQMFEMAASGRYDESPAQGFDFAWTPKAKLFSRAKGPRILARFVPRVDRTAVAETWGRAGKLIPDPDDEICIILLGNDVASKRELADAIGDQRRRPFRGGKVTLIPVDTRLWDALMPTDAPAVAKELLARLRSSA